MRINARLEETQARQLDVLCRRSHQSRTAVLKAAIEHYYREQMAESSQPREILMDNRFIGCGEAEPDLAQEFKRYLSPTLSEKIRGHR